VLAAARRWQLALTRKLPAALPSAPCSSPSPPRLHKLACKGAGRGSMSGHCRDLGPAPLLCPDHDHSQPHSPCFINQPLRSGCRQNSTPVSWFLPSTLLSSCDASMVAGTQEDEAGNAGNEGQGVQGRRSATAAGGAARAALCAAAVAGGLEGPAQPARPCCLTRRSPVAICRLCV
jgi:hypothetical protein